MRDLDTFDAIVVGGGPSGATAATHLAKTGHKVLLLDKAGRIKPCGGAIPPRLIRDFDIPRSLLVARATSARMIAPSDRKVNMPIDGGFVGMVDREDFDEWLRERAAARSREALGHVRDLRTRSGRSGDLGLSAKGAPKDKAPEQVRARVIVGADGASKVARMSVPNADKVPCVFAYHEIIKSRTSGGFEGTRYYVYYQAKLSPDFYAWVSRGDKTSVGVGSANKSSPACASPSWCQHRHGPNRTVREEGTDPRPLKKWDDGRNVVRR